ncbi:MAG TPA: SapC family protein [Albitalea sp.]|nr:SapC family protein [Albitalea sp.]
MIQSALYRQPELLDSVRHRHKRLQNLSDYSVTQQMHAVFVAASEFPLAALEFPIIFVNTGERLASGRPMVSPVALLGLVANENLRLAGTRWDARYVPAFIRRYPFLTAGVQGAQAPAVFVDASWSGFHDSEGEPLFDADGQPTPLLKGAIEFLQRFDAEQQRTRAFCTRVVELDLLKEMAADATLPNGETLKVEGLVMVDEEKLNALPDALVLELHRSGMLMLLQAHLMSLANMQQLVERKAARQMAATA